ncbi:MAG TPA: sulfatase [Bacillales bacterium]|nr:sulfatase [Bacillales bacterium]
MNVIVVLFDTMRIDHLSCYGAEQASNGLNEKIRTPHLDRFAKQSVRFTNGLIGSFPCMPARRELWTGRYEFPWRGWGPLEDNDFDFIDFLRSSGCITQLISDHYHLLERDAGNYHFGFSGWDMIRGQEHDPYITEPLADGTKAGIDHRTSGAWYLHQKNKRGGRRDEESLYAPRVFRKACSWLERNADRKTRRDKPFFLMVESFDPHEPWDPPLHRIERFDPGFEGKRPHSPVYGASSRFTDDELRHIRALYAAELTMVDTWFGRLLDQIDALDLWDDTMIVATTDHGFFLGEHGLVGKPDLIPLYNEMSRIPFMMYHPDAKRGTESNELVQLVDVFPTIVDALGLDLTFGRSDEFVAGKEARKTWEGVQSKPPHGISLMPALLGREPSKSREIAVTGKFGDILRVSDGKWSLYVVPDGDAPLYWHGRREPGRTFAGRRGAFDQVKERYPIQYPVIRKENELYHIASDPGETDNLIVKERSTAHRLRKQLAKWFTAIDAPKETLVRYGVSEL